MILVVLMILKNERSSKRERREILEESFARKSLNSIFVLCFWIRVVVGFFLNHLCLLPYSQFPSGSDERSVLGFLFNLEPRSPREELEHICLDELFRLPRQLLHLA